MSRVYVVINTFEDGKYIDAHSFLSRTAAEEFKRTNEAADREVGEKDSRYVVRETVIHDATEETYVRLQRQLSRVSNRLGKARKSLRQVKARYKDLLEMLWRSGSVDDHMVYDVTTNNVNEAAE